MAVCTDGTAVDGQLSVFESGNPGTAVVSILEQGTDGTAVDGGGTIAVQVDGGAVSEGFDQSAVDGEHFNRGRSLDLNGGVLGCDDLTAVDYGIAFIIDGKGICADGAAVDSQAAVCQHPDAVSRGGIQAARFKSQTACGSG